MIIVMMVAMLNPGSINQISLSPLARPLSKLFLKVSIKKHSDITNGSKVLIPELLLDIRVIELTSWLWMCSMSLLCIELCIKHNQTCSGHFLDQIWIYPSANDSLFNIDWRNWIKLKKQKINKFIQFLNSWFVKI